MLRDFSETSRIRFLELVCQVENEKWSDFTDWIGDRWLDLQYWIGNLNIKNYIDNVNEYHKKVIDKNNATKKSINDIFTEVKKVDSTYFSVFSSDKEVLQEIRNYVNSLSNIISPKNGLFQSNMIRIALNPAYLTLRYKLKSIKYVVYNPNNDGYYGGNQGAPCSSSEKKKQEYYEIIQKNNPDWELTEDELTNYLIKINSEGCGYVALINTIFCYYADDPDGFEKTFGYPIYDDNGQLNYDKLLVDIYSRMDNRDKYGRFDKYHDYDEKTDGPKDKYNYFNDRSGTGSNQYVREYYLEKFMQEHGVDVNVETNVYVDANNFEQITNSGKQVIIAYRNGYLHNMDGTIYDMNRNVEGNQPIDGGHAMTVTGITDDGMLIVSSWGKQFYIDPNEKITFTNDEGKKVTTSMTFSTVKYNA